MNKPANRRLTKRERLFIAEMQIDHNASKAALRAGYAEKNAGREGWRLMQKPEIRAAVEAAGAETLETLRITADDIARRAWQIAQENGRDRVAALALLAKRHPEFSEKAAPQEGERHLHLHGLSEDVLLALAETIRPALPPGKDGHG